MYSETTFHISRTKYLFYFNKQFFLTLMEENNYHFRHVSIYLLLCEILHSDKTLSYIA